MTSDTEDKVAIADLFTRYCCALDNGGVETVVDYFTADAALKSPMIDLKGHAAIRDFVGRFAAQQAAGVQFRHMVTNVAARIDGERATATAYLLVLISQNGAHRTLPPGGTSAISSSRTAHGGSTAAPSSTTMSILSMR
jgi:ketosteroid isomerase-like protein